MTPLEALRQELAPLVRRLLRRYDHNPTERILREATLDHVLRSLLASYHPGSGIPLRPYLVRQLSRLSIAPWEMLSSEAFWEDGQAVVALDHPFAGEDGPEAKAEFERTARAFPPEIVAQWLPEAIALLPYDERRAFLWHYYEDRALREMAERLNISESEILGLLARALTHLRQILSPAPCRLKKQIEE